MHRMMWGWIAGVLFMISAVHAPGTESLQLIPMPREITQFEGSVPLSDDWVIVVLNDDFDDVFAARQLAQEFQDCFGWQPELTRKPPVHQSILIRGCRPQEDDSPLFIEQGYRLWSASEMIVIEAPTSAGRFYGVQTLRQLLRGASQPAIPVLRIMDYPELRWRGVSDDISRGQISTVDDFRKIIRQLAYYKKNLYQPYIEDMFSFEVSPGIGRGRAPITRSEMALMVEEARRHHIILTPVFECLGHQDRLLSLPEHRKYAEIQDPDTTPWSFSPVLPESLEFIQKLIDEMAEATPSPFFHIGGDESFDIGQGTSKERVEEIGVGRVHAEFFTQLHDYIWQRHGRHTMLYGDMLLRHPEALDYLPKSAILVDWHYYPQEDYPSVRQFKDAGFRHLMTSPGIWSWMAVYPNYDYAFRNIEVLTRIGKEEKVLGSITSSWGDSGAENLRENNLLGFAYSAAVEWEEGAPDADTFLRRYTTTQYGVESAPLAEVHRLLGWHGYLGEIYPVTLFHKPLVVRTHPEEYLQGLRTLEENMRRVRSLLAEHADSMRFDRDHAASLRHAADRYLYLARRYQVMDRIARTLGSRRSGELAPREQRVIQRSLEGLRKDLLKITADFSRLWLRSNKHPMLNNNLDRLHRQIAEAQRLVTLAQTGELTSQPEPDAVWFWYPDDDPRTLSSEGTRYFIRSFDLSEAPVSAELRCWADDRAVVFINGEEISPTVYGSPPVRKRVEGALKKGRNYLAIEGFNSIGAAGILLELRIRLPGDEIVKITGDEDWRVAIEPGLNWQSSLPEDANWIPVKLLGKGLITPWQFLDWE